MERNFDKPKLEQREADIESNAIYEPSIFSVRDGGQVSPYDREDNIPNESGVVEKLWFRHFNTIRSKYGLILSISGLRYFFKLSGEEGGSSYYLSFKTLEYGFATTNLNDDNTKILFERLADFLETVYKDSGEKMSSIDINPASSAYSTADIEGCISEILKSSTGFSEEDLRKKYVGIKIFDLYSELFGKDYSEVDNNSKSKSRSRYFKIQFKKYFKYWEIDENFDSYVGFYLKRVGLKEAVVK